ncbi:unnamed protein product [Pieris macdunnoughi]|uniref:YqaJ viral recombinase domain-containing protein n=1 Tax=Pieris macdunnoughi TaxID=345717 RepID=A0A821XUW0_9NEOP|nr:unnamed protein product [Pieris macdunnoughi]
MLMPPELKLAKENFIKNLESLVADSQAVEKIQLSNNSSDWLALRKFLLTASNFGRVVKRKKRPENLVKDVLYKDNISDITSIAHGINNEKIALEQLSAQNNIFIEPCRLFVDNKTCSQHQPSVAIKGSFIHNCQNQRQLNPIVGIKHSPDGIVEVKCSVAPGKVGMDEAIKTNKIQIYKHNEKTNQTVINKNSNWFFQVQGQLMIAGREKCIFDIWGVRRNQSNKERRKIFEGNNGTKVGRVLYESNTT